MFDNVRSEVPLPDSRFQERVFQTKDTPGQCLEHYLIRADGQLVNEGAQYAVDELHIRRPEAPKEVDWTGEIHFYDFADYGSGERGSRATPVVFETERPLGWVEFAAIFLHGKLQGQIKLVSLDEEQKR